MRERPRSGLSYVVTPAKAGQARSAQNVRRGERSESSGAFRPVVGVPASVPPARRAFRSAAAARVTFLLLAQEKSNPKRMA